MHYVVCVCFAQSKVNIALHCYYSFFLDVDANEIKLLENLFLPSILPCYCN